MDSTEPRLSAHSDGHSRKAVWSISVFHTGIDSSRVVDMPRQFNGYLLRFNRLDIRHYGVPYYASTRAPSYAPSRSVIHHTTHSSVRRGLPPLSVRPAHDLRVRREDDEFRAMYSIGYSAIGVCVLWSCSNDRGFEWESCR